MRTEKELWEVVLSHQELFGLGLCGWVSFLKEDRHISFEEYKFLGKVLDRHLPERKDGWMWCWTRGEIQPRIDWIKKRIETL